MLKKNPVTVVCLKIVGVIPTPAINGTNKRG
jgi:hypothetical protein